MDNEMIQKAMSAGSPEELLKMALDAGMTGFTEENARAYYSLMHQSGEITDEELENAAGGCKSNKRRVVTLGYICPVNYGGWKCKDCLAPNNVCKCWLQPPELSRKFHASIFAWCADTCSTCAWCSYESGIWYCNNPEANEL